MRAESTKCRPSAFFGVLLNRYATAVLAHTFILDVAWDQREEGVVAANAHAFARRDPGSALADQDGARGDELPAVDLHTEHLRVGVAAVARRPAALLVRQLLRLLLGSTPGRLLRRLGLFFHDRLGVLFSDLGLGRRLLPRRGLGPSLW